MAANLRVVVNSVAVLPVVLLGLALCRIPVLSRLVPLWTQLLLQLLVFLVLRLPLLWVLALLHLMLLSFHFSLL